MTEETIFSKIIKGEIPCSKIYEDETHLAFLDIFPFEKGHTLLIPKKPYKKISDMPEEEYTILQKVALKLIKHLEKQLQTRTGMLVYGLDVPHVHIHIFPITNDLKIFNFSKTKKYLGNETENYVKKLKL